MECDKLSLLISVKTSSEIEGVKLSKDQAAPKNCIIRDNKGHTFHPDLISKYYDGKWYAEVKEKKGERRYLYETFFELIHCTCFDKKCKTKCGWINEVTNGRD